MRLAILLLICACSHGAAPEPPADPDAGDAGEVYDPPDSGSTDTNPPDAGPTCVTVGFDATPIVAAPDAGEQTLRFVAHSASHTQWSEPGNEALVLEVLSPRGLVAHVVMHQGAADFRYGLQLGALQAGDGISMRVSPLSAASATAQACVSAPQLAAADEGAANAPILKWPVQKRFDDLPVILGWSKTRKTYELFYTNENGGTAALCGGGADGMRAEIARWGRGCDIERIFSYGTTSSWERCTGTVDFATLKPRLEALHPILYYGDGHNRLFESRGGYGATCGTTSDKQADGDLAGWNVQNPGNDAAHDAPFTLTVRPLPVDLDALGFASSSGRREAVQDKYAPWLYRITSEELRREGKIDDAGTFPVDQYLYVDVKAADVDGGGDGICSTPTSGGFVLRARLDGGATVSGPQMTAAYFGTGTQWKRIAIPLAKPYSSADFTGFTFDAYDKDGIYFLALGDAFISRPGGDNSASIDPVRSGVKAVNVFVDDDKTGCDGGVTIDGGVPCVGGSYTTAK